MDERTSSSNYNHVFIAFKLYSFNFNKDLKKIPDCMIRHIRFNSGRWEAFKYHDYYFQIHGKINKKCKI